MTHAVKRDFPVSQIRRFLEPGPVVLVSSHWKGEQNIMTMGWHMIMEFSPSLIGCFITGANYSFDMIRKSKECVINVPTVDMIDAIVGIGNCSGEDTDKFETFGLTPLKAKKVKAPLIKECPVNIECKLIDTSMINKYNLFIFEAVKAHALTKPAYPKTVHYHGDGMFTVAGKTLNCRKKFKKENL